MRVCKICGNKSNSASYTVREMLLGTREEFEYLKCSVCGCLQIVEVPDDMDRYYPASYHSFDLGQKKRASQNFVREKLKNYWKRAYINGGFLNDIFVSIAGKPGVPKWILKAGVNTKARVLDIGCGDGSRLLRMHEIGFKNLAGIDRYNRHLGNSKHSIKFIYGELSELQGSESEYDLIMLHHSLEHMDDQGKIFTKINELLSDRGCLVIRIPIVSSYAWRKYKTNWFALDAPRHFYLHTEDSLKLLASNSGFEIMDIYYDSNVQSLWASEQYVQDISFMDERSIQVGSSSSIFCRSDLAAFRVKANELNKAKQGDQACFILRKNYY
jgi:2-polyprenyl-3-methyl-5-hydroxy-6-metoxy-1,4-benzoquinol methylase